MERYGSTGTQFGGYHLTPWVKRLLIANIAVFIATTLLPDLRAYLQFRPSEVLFAPWTVVTYMFTHGGFMHIFFNLLMLFFFGPPVEEQFGGRDFIKYYLLCGLGGAALSFVFAFGDAVVGASAAVFGVMLAFAMLWPDVRIYIWGIFPVKAKHLVMGLVALDLIPSVFGSSDGIAHFAHLGGALAGFLYIKMDSKTGNAGQKLKRMMTRRKFKVVPGSTHPKPEPPRPPRRRDDDRALDDVDKVLDKISTQGMASLTPDERRLLDEVSRRYRQN